MCDVENLKNEEAMTRTGSQRHSKKHTHTHTHATYTTLHLSHTVENTEIELFINFKTAYDTVRIMY